MAQVQELAIANAAVVTAAGALTGVSANAVNRPFVNSEGYTSMLIQVECTAASGTTPALNGQIEGKANKAAQWAPLKDRQGNIMTITQITAATTEGEVLLYEGPVPASLRFNATSVTGTTPSFTINVIATLGG